MSSTNRGYERNSHDYYITPDWIIKSFLDKFLEVELINKSLFILDPSSGGDSINLAPYPKILKEYGFLNIRTSDIREDSDSERKGVDYLTVNWSVKNETTNKKNKRVTKRFNFSLLPSNT